MAHFAKLGSNGKVIQVLTLDNKDMLNANDVEDESVGQQYLERHNNWPAQMWIQTSYNTSGNKHSSGDDSKAFRGNYAGIGYEWDEDNNIFWPKKPFASWVKNTTDARNWIIVDNKRLGYNPTNYQLYPNEANSEGSNSGWIDLLSNGFKIRTSDSGFNISGDTYIYAAFAEFPFVSSNSKAGVAR